jgi:signal transduction histidine kinase
MSIMVKVKHSFDPETLKSLPFFAAFSSRQVEGILEVAQITPVKASQVILRQGERAAAIYLILSGGVKVERMDGSGGICMQCDMGKGQVVGQLSILRHEPSSVTVTSTRETVLMSIDRVALLNLVRNADPEQVLDAFLALDGQMRTSLERGFKEMLSQQMLGLQMEAEKQRALTQMVAGVAHEINTPLSVINTAVNIMARELAAPVEVTIQRAADIAESLELMRLNVERADQLVRNFKRISISQLKDEKEPLDIVEAIEETIGLVRVSLKRSQVHVRFHNKLTPEQKKWIGYRGFLSQVIINLLINVERYAYPKSGGFADVTIRLEDDQHYCLSVKDHGRGITQEDQAHIFDPLFTTGKNSGGTGLGLAIVHNLVVNTFKGRIELKSEEGKGAEFDIVFPREISD